MSYSACLSCLSMVRSYEKYCETCVKTKNLRQDYTWHMKNRFPGDDMERKEIVDKDRLKEESRNQART